MVAYHPYSLPVYTYVAFGGEGLPAMLPILLPTLVIAVAVMALSDGAARKRRTWRAASARRTRARIVSGGGYPAGRRRGEPDRPLVRNSAVFASTWRGRHRRAGSRSSDPPARESR